MRRSLFYFRLVLLGLVEKGESITITKRGKPVAVLSPVRQIPVRGVVAVIAEFRAYSKEQARKHRSLSAGEIKEMTDEGLVADRK